MRSRNRFRGPHPRSIQKGRPTYIALSVAILAVFREYADTLLDGVQREWSRTLSENVGPFDEMLQLDSKLFLLVPPIHQTISVTNMSYFVRSLKLRKRSSGYYRAALRVASASSASTYWW
jgi:hypothetical protein